MYRNCFQNSMQRAHLIWVIRLKSFAQGIYCSAGETADKTTIVKLVNTTDNEVSIDLENEEGKALMPVKETVMCAALTDYNCAKNSMCVAPKETVECSSEIKMAPQSFIIVEIK